MKKLMKRFSSILLGTAVALSVFAFPAFAADASINYEGGAEKFVFLPGSDMSDTDLFDNFKGIMPGDTAEQMITVKNNYKGCDYVNIYLRADAHDAENPLIDSVAKVEDTASMNDFLSQLSMKVYNGETVIYEASPDELDGMEENVLIAALAKGAKADLKVVLEVPIELGNEYANRTGEVDWIFTVEERNRPSGGGGGGGGSVKPDEPIVETEIIVIEPEEELPFGVLGAFDEIFNLLPATGDNTMIWVYVLVLGAGIIGLALTVFKRDKREE